jgi:hypothetical protein
MTITDPTSAPAMPTMTTASGAAVDEEMVVAVDELAADRAKFEALVGRLSAQSVTKHYDAYADIPWDAPGYEVDPDDPRWVLPAFDALGRTEWYLAQPDATKSRIGLYRYAAAAKLGMEFENILVRGLLEYTFFRVRNDDPRFRYVYHEVAEETHHGMMFQEFVNRTGTKPRGLPWILRWRTTRIVSLGHWFPELFFFFVLGGEDPIDHIQREMLRNNDDLPPIFELIMRHHVTEEARHLSFARHYLKLEVPRLPWAKRLVLAVATPIILGVMAQMMIMPPRDMAKRFDIPKAVMHEAYRDNEDMKRGTTESVRKVRKLARELGLINPLTKRIWMALGIYSND